jgi:hypothetical protein
MNIPYGTVEILITRRLEDMAARYEYHVNNGDLDLADLIRKEGLALAEAYDYDETILVAEALF